MTKREHSKARFTARVIEHLPNCDIVGVFDNGDQIGAYERHRPLWNTFFAFDQGDKWYALFYTNSTIRLMSLPDCNLEFGWEQDLDAKRAFYPVDFYVPTIENEGLFLMDMDHDDHWRERDQKARDVSGTFGFVFGCVWGGPYEVQYLDLSKASEGIIVRERRWGSELEIPDDLTLEECIEIEHDDGNPYGMMISVKKFVRL